MLIVNAYHPPEQLLRLESDWGHQVPAERRQDDASCTAAM